MTHPRTIHGASASRRIASVTRRGYDNPSYFVVTNNKQAGLHRRLDK